MEGKKEPTSPLPIGSDGGKGIKDSNNEKRSSTNDYLNRVKTYIPTIPSELKLTQKWSYAFETIGLRFTYGTLTGIFASFVLLPRSMPGARFGVIGFMAGCGVGDGYRLANIEFEKDRK